MHPCRNCCPLKKEASLTKADSSTSLWASKSINIYKASRWAHGVYLAKWWCWYYSFPIWMHDLLGYGLLATLQYQTCIPSCGWSPNREELVTSIKIMPLLHQCAHNCLELHRTHSWGSTLLITFLLITSCMEPSGTMKASQHGGNFQLSSHLISLYPATKVCGIFSNVVLIVVGRTQQRWPIAELASLANNSGKWHTPVTGIFI